MPKKPPMAVLSRLGAPLQGVFRGRQAIDEGVTRDQLARLRTDGTIERVHPDVFRLTAVVSSHEQRLRAALLWAGEAAAATGCAAAVLYGLDGVKAATPEVALPPDVRGRSATIVVRHGTRAAFMTRRVRASQ